MRERLIKLIEESTGCTYGGPYGDVTIEEEIDIDDREIARIADYLIANGVTILVRCGDCKHAGHCTIERELAKYWTTLSDDFCPYGERWDDGQSD